MFESYRVLRKFQWRSYSYAPKHGCNCQCSLDETLRLQVGCSGQTGTGCQCPDNGYCACGIKPEQYAGDVWVVESGNPRKEYILLRRFAVYDSTLEAGDVLAGTPEFKRFLQAGFPEGHREVIVTEERATAGRKR